MASGSWRTPPATGQWVGGVLRARTACGRLSGLRRDPAFDWSSVAVLTADDLPGPNAVAMIVDDYRILAADDIRFATEALAPGRGARPGHSGGGPWPR